MTRRELLGAAAVALAVGACAQLEKIPGGSAATSYIERRARDNAGKAADNVVDAVATGKLDRSATFSMEQEFYLGKTIAANVLARLGGHALPPDHPAALYVRDVGTVVALAAADLRTEEDRPYPFEGYHFIVVEAPQVNAVGMPGGFVAVTTGMLGAVRSEDELAAVLAHEIAHVQRGHAMGPVESARRQEHITSTVLAGTDEVVHAFFGKVVTLGTDFVLDRGYGKANELDADAAAVATLRRAGYDPAALERFLARLEGKAAEGGFFSRHPPAVDRVDALRDLLPVASAAPPAGSRAERFRARLSAVR